MGSHHQLTPTISHSAFCCMLRSGRSGESGTLALWGLVPFMQKLPESRMSTQGLAAHRT